MKTSAFFIMVVLLGRVVSLHAQEKAILNVDNDGIIIQGYDPVSYFDNKPQPGKKEFQSKYNNAIYLFSSDENKKKFDANPAKYEVQFNGFCAYAVSQGHVSPIDPKFCIVQKDVKGVDRLICQHNQKAADLWNVAPDKLFIDAYQYWPAVQKNGGKQIALKGHEMPLLNLLPDGTAIMGYDAVAYHTEQKARKGSTAYVEWYHGARYQFVSKENQDLFRDNPKKYIPEYGGFCAYAMSLGKLRPINPELFSIENGRLMLQHTQEAYDLFKKDVPGNIRKADEKWPNVQQKRQGKKVKYDKPAK